MATQRWQFALVLAECRGTVSRVKASRDSSAYRRLWRSSGAHQKCLMCLQSSPGSRLRSLVARRRGVGATCRRGEV